MPYSPERRLLAVILSLVLTPALAEDTAPAHDADDPGTIRVLLVAGLETTLSSQMSGTLGEFKASLGQTVAKDAVLARFDCAEAQARSRVAAAELTMARQNLDAKRNLRKLDAVGDLEVAMANTELQKPTAPARWPRHRAATVWCRRPLPGVWPRCMPSRSRPWRPARRCSTWSVMAP